LFTVMVHELGHALGLGDNNDPNSVMDGEYQGVRTGLSAGDVTNIQALYGASAPNASTAASAALQQLAAGNVSASTPQDFRTLTINRSQVMYFSLTAGSVPAGVQAGVRMAIFDGNGHAVSTLFARAGQTVSASVYLDLGAYTIRFEDLSPSGTNPPPLGYTLQGITLTDPLSTVLPDGTTNPVDYTVTQATYTLSNNSIFDPLGGVSFD
jgi:hypothetical protein